MRETTIFNRSITKERLATFSDAVFAVIITIMVLQLRLPAHPTFQALLAAWPTALSYVVSYVFVMIMWINHHFLLTFAKETSPRLVLLNCTHIFAASLVPFATAWVAATKMASIPVFTYAAVIVIVNLSYHAFASEVMPRNAARRAALLRSALTLTLFTGAMLLSLRSPFIAFVLISCLLLTYVRPDIPRAFARLSRTQSLR